MAWNTTMDAAAARAGGYAARQAWARLLAPTKQPSSVPSQVKPLVMGTRARRRCLEQLFPRAVNRFRELIVI